MIRRESIEFPSAVYARNNKLKVQLYVVVRRENVGNALQILILHICANTFHARHGFVGKAAISFYFRFVNNLNAFLLFTSLLLGHVLVVIPRECEQRQQENEFIKSYFLVEMLRARIYPKDV